jgi:enoyl-CoA hydratase
MPLVTLEDRDGIAVLTLTRPPANAMDVHLLEALVAAVDGIAQDPPKAVVVAGENGFFSAGADLKAVPAYSPDEQRRSVNGINFMALGIYALPCPVVGAITGHAIAGGFVLALTPDVRIASAQGKYGLTEVKVGVPYPVAAMAVVKAELSPSAARFIGLSNELIDAHECHRLGAFDEVVELDDVLPRALETAERLGAMPARDYARAKEQLRGETIARMRSEVDNDPLFAGWAA